MCRDQKLFPSKLGPISAKTGMKELFAQPKMKKDGTQSKVRIFWLSCSRMYALSEAADDDDEDGECRCLSGVFQPYQGDQMFDPL